MKDSTPSRQVAHGVATAAAILDCGGKRSATPLWNEQSHLLIEPRASWESGVAAALGHRVPKPLRLGVLASWR